MISSETSGAAASPAAQPASPSNPDIQALKQAFLRGAGVAPEAIAAELTPEMMELLGKMIATCLQGNIDLLSLRSLVKQEVHADVTTVLVRNNNPLKFFPDSQTVLIQMLRKKMPGFMEPLEALDDACSDLRGHQLGVVAGARAGMQSTLARLAPAAVDGALPPGGLLEKVLPSVRVQRQWDHYRQRHADAVRATDEQLFGPAFLAAYEAAVDEVKEGDGGTAANATNVAAAAPRSRQP
jgi:type VI secretion system FHA domain protein